MWRRPMEAALRPQHASRSSTARAYILIASVISTPEGDAGSDGASGRSR